MLLCFFKWHTLFSILNCLTDEQTIKKFVYGAVQAHHQQIIDASYECFKKNVSLKTHSPTGYSLARVLLFISDGLPGMTNAIHRVYPRAKHQVCCVHVYRNIAAKVRVKDRAAILDGFKAVYQAIDQEEAVNALEQLKLIHGSTVLIERYNIPDNISAEIPQIKRLIIH